MREQAVEADRDPHARQHVRDREHDQVLPVQGAAPRQPAGEHDRRQGHRDHDAVDRALGALVLDRDHFGLALRWICG
jgi:hypothetical protein